MIECEFIMLFFFSSRRRHTRFDCDWSSDVCSSDLVLHLVLDGVDFDLAEKFGFVVGFETRQLLGRRFHARAPPCSQWNPYDSSALAFGPCHVMPLFFGALPR